MSVLSKRTMRVLHCPTNIAGQMWEYVQGLRALGIKATALTFAPHPFGYQDDICLNLPLEPSVWRRRIKLIRNFINVAKRYDVIHFHIRTLLPRYLDLPLLRLLDKKMVITFWGSDVRLKAIAEKNNPYYPSKNHIGDDNVKSHRLRRISCYVEVATVADYELYSYVVPFFKRVAIIPQAVDTRKLQPHLPKSNKAVPLVVHMPSRRDIKGTYYVEKAISRLKKRYRFGFQLLHKVTNQEVKDALKEADIVIDQLLLGTYGIASIEAMALGKPVLCYIRDDLIEKYPKDLPIVNANPDTIEEELEKLLISPQLRAEIGERSRRFVERYHDARIVARRLIELYESL